MSKKNVATIQDVRFNLKSHKGNKKPVLIIAVFRYEGQRLLYSTQTKILPKYWSTKRNRAYARLDDSGDSDLGKDIANINKELDLINNKIKKVYSKLHGKSFDKETFKLKVDYAIGRKVKPKNKKKDHKTLFEFFDTQIKKHKKRVDGLKGGQTWQKYQTLKNRLISYAEHLEQSEINYKEIDEDFKDNFIEWLYGKDLGQNTVSKEIVTLKHILKISKKYHKNTYYTDENFKVDRKKIPKNFPTLSELKHLFHFEFKNQRLQNAIDLFLISAFGGGLRWSDVKRLTNENEIVVERTDPLTDKKYTEKVLQVFTYKGRETKEDNEVVVPITPQLRHLIDKYDWKFPKVTEQEVNRTIKEAFKKAGLNRKVRIKSSKRGGSTITVPLHEDVSFHRARYAYINYMLNDLDVPVESLKEITGQSMKILLGYQDSDKKKVGAKVGAMINQQLAGLKVVKNEAV